MRLIWSPRRAKPARRSAASALAATVITALSLVVTPTAAADSGTESDSAAAAAPTVIDATASRSTLEYGEAVVIRYTLTSNGAPVANAPTTVSFGRHVLPIVTDAAGRGAIGTRSIPVGNAAVIIRYAGDAEHAKTSGTLRFTVTPRPVAIEHLAPASGTKITGAATTVSFTVTTGGTPFAKARVAITYLGRTAWVRADANGQVAYPLSALRAGTSTILVRYFGDATHGRATATTSIQVSNPCPATARACVDLTNNVSWLQHDGVVTYGPVPITSGRPGYRTRTGTFRVFWMHKNHVSSIYHSPMPNSIFFDGGIAFHEGSLSIPSHGCIHLGGAASQAFWDGMRTGDSVYVWGSAKY